MPGHVTARPVAPARVRMKSRPAVAYVDDCNGKMLRGWGAEFPTGPLALRCFPSVLEPWHLSRRQSPSRCGSEKRACHILGTVMPHAMQCNDETGTGVELGSLWPAFSEPLSP